MAATLEELEARVAALAADRADYRAVLTSVNALSTRVGGQQEAIETLTVRADAHHESINALGLKLAAHQQEFRVFRGEMVAFRDETRANFRSVDEHVAEMKDLLIEALGR